MEVARERKNKSSASRDAVSDGASTRTLIADDDIPQIDDDFLQSIGLKLTLDEDEVGVEITGTPAQNNLAAPVVPESPASPAAISASAPLELEEDEYIPPQEHSLEKVIETNQSEPAASSSLVKNVTEVLEKSRSVETTALVQPHENTALREKPKVAYPSLVERTREAQIKPLSRTELKQYYVNPELQALEIIVDQFVEVNRTQGFVKHPLHIYLTDYLKALSAYETSLFDLKVLQKSYDVLKDQVWKITDNKAVEYGRCGDGKSVSAEHFYRQCHLNKTALIDLGKNLEKIRQTLHHTSFRFKCSSELARFQVECFLFDTIQNNPCTVALDSTSPITPRAECIKLSETDDIRACISVLFAFHRIPSGSDKFREDIRKWLTSCVGVLLRVSTFYDQLFLLNHLLRCPSTVISWGCAFVQIPVPNIFHVRNCSSPFVKHFLTMLKFLLIPAKARHDFLAAFDVHSLENEPDSDWIVVDPDTDQDGPVSSTVTIDVQENDIFQLLQQFQFDALFSCVCGSHVVDLELFFQVTPYDVLALFGFCHELMDVLVEGLQNPALNKYPRFNKKIAQILRESVIHCREFWERFLEVKAVGEQNVIRNLKIQYEELLLRGMQILLEHGKNGTLQFLIGWPIKNLSAANIWRAVVILESSPNSEHPYSEDLTYWKRQVTFIQIEGKLEDNVRFLDEASAVYLLTAISTLISGCDKSMVDLVEAVTKDLLKLCFLSSLRQSYSKIGRDVISTICASHPNLISEVVSFARKNLAEIGSMSVYLFQEIPLKLWQPFRADVEMLCEWLVNAKSIQDVQCLLAREILSNLNWEFAENGELNIVASVHYLVAVAVVEAFMKFISTKNRRSLLYEGLMRLSNMVVGGKSSPEQLFVGWCWEMLLDLKLHRLTQFRGALNLLKNNSVLDDDVPSLTRDVLTVGPLQAAQQRQPMACYVAVMMTDVGHSTTGILDQGLDWINALIENYLYLTAMQVLEAVTPLFFANSQFEYLVQQELFHQIIGSVLQADATYLRMVKNMLVTDFPGKNLTSFGNMLIHQLLHAGSNLPLALRMWTKVFTSLRSWNRSKEALYILDHLVKFAFYAREFGTIMSALREAYAEFRNSKPKSGVTSLVSWITAGNANTVMIDSSNLPDCPWLAYAVLLVETEYMKPVWNALLNLMTVEKKRIFEEAVKKACHETNSSTILPTDLPIYRVTQLIVDVKVDSEILPLLCQEFFKLFLQRSQSQKSIGDQFFLSATGVKLLKPMKQKFCNAGDYYRKRATALEEKTPAFYQDLQHVIKAFTCWIDEPKLHQSSLYLPALPPEYEPELLATVIHPTCGPWTHFVDLQNLYSAMRRQAEHWLPFEIKPARARSLQQSVPTKMLDCPVGEPGILELSSRNPPYIPVDESSLFDPSKVLFILRPDLMVVQDAARSHDTRMTQHMALDIDFVELIADLNGNVNKETVQFMPCHKGNCAEPAEIKLKFKEFCRNEQVHRNYIQNRDEWLKLVSESPKTDLRNLVNSVMRFEKAISRLVEAQTRSSDDRASEVGAVLFYHMLLFMGPETEQHPLASKFFTSCLEILGQYFIANQPRQCANLLDTCLNNQRAVPLLLPHFTPNSLPKELLGMYRKLQNNLEGEKNVVLIQMLSAFDIQTFLQDSSVDVSSRLELLQLIIRGISKLGSSPSFQDYPLLETYSFHLRALLSYRFPLHLIDILRALLDLCSQQRIPQNAWMSCLFNVLGVNLLKDLESLDAESLEEQSASIIVSVKSGKISAEMAVVVLQELTQFFGAIRRKSGGGELYEKWGDYSNAMAVLCLVFSTVVIISGLRVDEIFRLISELYSPWIVSKSVSKIIVASLRISLQQQVEISPRVLVDIWEYFYHLNQSGQDLDIAAVATEFTQLTWEKFEPGPRNLEQFLAVKSSAARKFTGAIFLRIQWKNFLSRVLEKQPENISAVISNLTKLVFSFAVDPEFRPFTKETDYFIEETCNFNWQFLTLSELQHSVSSLLNNPEELATWNGSGMESAPVTRLLKLVTEFNEENLCSNLDTIGKRAVFVQIYGRSCIAWHTKRDQNAVVPFVKETLSQVEKSWFSASPDLRYKGYQAAAGEVFSWSNHVTDKKVENFLRSAILIWISFSPSSPMIIPMITSCCRCVVNLDQMVQYLEVLIDAHFRGAGQIDWTPVIYSIEPPEISSREFVKECLVRQSYLALYAHFNKLYQTGSRSRDELFAEVIEWCKARPLAENEARCYLLWNQALIMATNLPNPNVEMRTFLESIFGFTEDRGGLLSAIGVGKVSALSRTFKLLARSLAVVGGPMTPNNSVSRSPSKSTFAGETRNAYEAMKSRKEYAQFGRAFEAVDYYVQSQGSLNWNDVREMFVKLVRMFFGESQFLTVIWE